MRRFAFFGLLVVVASSGCVSKELVETALRHKCAHEAAQAKAAAADTPEEKASFEAEAAESLDMYNRAVKMDPDGVEKALEGKKCPD